MRLEKLPDIPRRKTVRPRAGRLLVAETFQEKVSLRLKQAADSLDIVGTLGRADDMKATPVHRQIELLLYGRLEDIVLHENDFSLLLGGADLSLADRRFRNINAGHFEASLSQGYRLSAGSGPYIDDGPLPDLELNKRLFDIAVKPGAEPRHLLDLKLLIDIIPSSRTNKPPHFNNT